MHALSALSCSSCSWNHWYWIDKFCCHCHSTHLVQHLSKRWYVSWSRWQILNPASTAHKSLVLFYLYLYQTLLMRYVADYTRIFQWICFHHINVPLPEMLFNWTLSLACWEQFISRGKRYPRWVIQLKLTKYCIGSQLNSFAVTAYIIGEHWVCLWMIQPRYPYVPDNLKMVNISLIFKSDFPKIME